MGLDDNDSGNEESHDGTPSLSILSMLQSGHKRPASTGNGGGVGETDSEPTTSAPGPKRNLIAESVSASTSSGTPASMQFKLMATKLADTQIPNTIRPSSPTSSVMDVIGNALKELAQVRRENRDFIDAFADYVGQTLRTIPAQQQVTVINKIQQVLVKTKFN